MTTFNEDVEINGSLDVLGTQDEPQLEVQAAATQTVPLQTWKDSSANVLGQISEDGNVQLGDDLMGWSTPDALIEAHRAETSTAKPKRGLHTLGRVTNLVSDAIHCANGLPRQTDP